MSTAQGGWGGRWWAQDPAHSQGRPLGGGQRPCVLVGLLVLVGGRGGVYTSYSAPGGLREGLLRGKDACGGEIAEAQPLLEQGRRDQARGVGAAGQRPLLGQRQSGLPPTFRPTQARAAAGKSCGA